MQQVLQQSAVPQAHSPPVSQVQSFASQTHTSQTHADPQHEQAADCDGALIAAKAKGIAARPKNIFLNILKLSKLKICCKKHKV